MTMRDALEQAMGRQPDGDAMRRLEEQGVTLLRQDTMSQAIHDVYCGIMADHTEPNAKDRDQARAMISALQKRATEPSQA